MVATAEHDPLRDEGEAYAARLADAGVPVVATRHLGTLHFFTDPTRFDEADALIDQLAALLRRVPAQAGHRAWSGKSIHPPRGFLNDRGASATCAGCVRYLRCLRPEIGQPRAWRSCRLIALDRAHAYGLPVAVCPDASLVARAGAAQHPPGIGGTLEAASSLCPAAGEVGR